MTIGQNLKNIRISKGISQSKLARKTGIDRKLIINYENDRVDFGLKRAIKISQNLGVSVADLIQVSIEKQAPKTNIEKIKLLDIQKMAKFLSRGLFCPYAECKNKNPNENCYSCIREWLQKECEE